MGREAVGFLLAAIGLVAFGIASYMLFGDITATMWPQGEAKILSFDVVPAGGEGGGGANAQQCTLAVSYEYEVGGRAYRSNRYKLHETRYARAEAERIQRLYVVGRTRSMYYNPKHPEIAILEQDFRFWLPAVWFAGLVLLLAGLKQMTSR